MEDNPTWRISNMAITGDLAETDSPYQYGEELTNLISTTYYRLEKGKIKNPQFLHQLIQKYDNVPAFKNYLVIFYINKGKKDKARAANRWLIKEHPEYLFGKLNLCAEYLEDNKLEEIPKVLGDALDLSALYPEREVFHAHEFAAFTNISCRYLILSGQLEWARSYINMTSDVLGEDHDLVRHLNESCAAKELLDAVQPYMEAMEKRFENTVFPESHPLPAQTTEAPAFTHPQIQHLYTYSYDIEPALIEELLQLPRESLIEDLEKVLIDAAVRYEYFDEERVEKGWKKVPCSFVLHAMALLGELRAKESLPKMLKILAYDDFLVDLYLGDHLFETIWQFIYKMYQDDVRPFKAYLIDPETDSDAKLVLLQVITRVGLQQAEQREEMIKFYEELLDVFLENLDDPRISDYDVASSLVAELCDLQAEHLLPKIKLLYDLELVDLELCGDYEEIATDITATSRGGTKYKVYDSIPELYHHILSTWASFEEDESEEEEEYPLLDDFERKQADLDASRTDRMHQPPVTTSPDTSTSRKIGRNEPCPCGSGKKYKRCCWGK